jgi:hypothetical protein
VSPIASQIKVDKTKTNVKNCICTACPSFGFACQMKAKPKNTMEMMKHDIFHVDHMEILFCAFDKSNCIDAPKGCVCPDCPVHSEYKLDKMYYCLANGGQ